MNPEFGTAVVLLFTVFGCAVLIVQAITMDWTEKK